MCEMPVAFLASMVIMQRYQLKEVQSTILFDGLIVFQSFVAMH